VPEEIDAREISLFDFDSTYENQLGLSKNNSDYAPAWQVYALESDIATSAAYLSSSTSTSRNLPIPQINIDSDSIAYKTVISRSESIVPARSVCEEEGDHMNDDEFFVEFPDGTNLSIEANQILLKFKEMNVEKARDNFEFEIFEVMPNEKLKPLKFFKFQPKIQNGILLDDDFGEKDIENLNLIDETFASYFFEISVDQEVDQGVICRTDPDRKDDTIFIKDFISCEEIGGEQVDLYGEIDNENMEDFFDEEECE
jgi:hypothetical protein